MTETDKSSCFDNPLGYAVRVSYFRVVFGYIGGLPGVKAGHYATRRQLVALPRYAVGQGLVVILGGSLRRSRQIDA